MRLNYLERIKLSYLTHMMSMVDFVAINMKISRIDSWKYFEKEVIELIRMNPYMILYLNVN